MNHPLLYEVNTRCWLRELSQQVGEDITLGNVPDRHLKEWRRLGFTHIWLMGVWTTGPRARAIAQNEPNLHKEYDLALPGWTDDDVEGSAYSVADFHVPDSLGGEAGLREFRRQLHAHGLKLILDFVPNHLGLDHPWLHRKPELFVQSPTQRDGTFPQSTVRGDCWIAHGRDPNFAPWSDTAQLDYRKAETRRAMTDLLASVAARCDGVRCDVSMLLLNDVFQETWQDFSVDGTPPKGEFWQEAIAKVRETHPDFMFLAEAYWDLEARLQTLGFDFTYDKPLYDALIWHKPDEAVQRLLKKPPKFISRGAHFLENHDEQRVASALSFQAHRTAALAILVLPGMRFLHDGQLTGATARVPVQLRRRAPHSTNPDIATMYQRWLDLVAKAGIGNGECTVLKVEPAGDADESCARILAVQWLDEHGRATLLAINLASSPSRGRLVHSIHSQSAVEVLDLVSGRKQRLAPGASPSGSLALNLPGYGACRYVKQGDA